MENQKPNPRRRTGGEKMKRERERGGEQEIEVY